jgi:hypothetical protein
VEDLKEGLEVEDLKEGMAEDMEEDLEDDDTLWTVKIEEFNSNICLTNLLPTIYLIKICFVFRLFSCNIWELFFVLFCYSVGFCMFVIIH